MFPASKALLTAVRSASRLNLHTSAVRNGHAYVYRSPPHPPSKNNVLLAELMGGFVWFWIFYRCLNDWQVFTNEWPYPDLSKWSDAELGIPPLEEDD